VRPIPLLGLAVLLSTGCAGGFHHGYGTGCYPPGPQVWAPSGCATCRPTACGQAACGPCGYNAAPGRWYRSWEAFWLTLKGGPITVLSVPPASGPGSGATPYVPPPMPTFGIDPATAALQPSPTFYETPLPPGAPERLREPPVPQTFSPPMPLPSLPNTAEPAIAPVTGGENRLIPVTTR